MDYVATIPVIGQGVAGFFSMFDFGGGTGDTIATMGGQLGAQSGAINIPTTLSHANAGEMLDLAKSAMAEQKNKVKSSNMRLDQSNQ